MGPPFLHFHPLGRQVLGYKVHAAVCTVTGLPLAWQVETAKDSELPLVPTLLDIMEGRSFAPFCVVLDRGYDASNIYDEIEAGTCGR